LAFLENRLVRATPVCCPNETPTARRARAASQTGGPSIPTDAPLQDTHDFNHQAFDEDKAIVEKQFPEDLPINLQEEVHIRAVAR
jgi:hypothetical protein